MNWFHTLIMTVVLALTLTACKTEDPNPELRDPIYKDLLSRNEGYKKAIEEGKKKVEDLKVDLGKSEPQTIERKNAERDLASAQAALLQNTQWELYYRIRAERRRVEGRADYRRAFNKDQEWPDPREYSDYLTNIHLRSAQMNWNARVPKLQDRQDKARKPAAAVGKGHGEAPAAAEHE